MKQSLRIFLVFSIVYLLSGCATLQNYSGEEFAEDIVNTVADIATYAAGATP